MQKAPLLDKIYRDIETVILSRQHPVTGFFPASTAINSHGDYTDAWVRDNVYTIMSVWALSLAYKKRGEKEYRDRLEQATVTQMRGLLQAMMRQSHKVEAFKHSLEQGDCLHAKYDTETGLEVVADDAWGHLQIDATSLFLLMLAQMTASGLRLVFTQGEVDFVQNLIYYISRAYRIPDFGIWERGNKINNGKTEVNASSVGMAKAALQALDNFNLFGADGPPWAVVHTIADSIARARTTLQALLPRESRSKEVDSALLSIIGFPAFAVSDTELVHRTQSEILSKLAGNYGCKRFLLDGHQTVLEDAHRIHYEHAELAKFENIESEWPLFYSYLFINSLFDGDDTQAAYYRNKLESLMVEKDGLKLLPELYYVPEEFVEAEKKDPGSQPRVPNDNVPLVWAQSLYTVGLLLDEGYIDPDDLDAVNLRGQQRRHNKPSVALVILAKNEKVKKKLAEHGILSETLSEILPLRVISASHLVEVFQVMGANDKLGLTGRPERALQSLTTSHPYRVNDQQLLCLSWLQNDTLDYRKHDAQLLSETLYSEINHIKKHWFYREPAVFTLLVTEKMFDMPGVELMYKTLSDFQHRTIDQRISHATADLAYRAARVNSLDAPEICLNTISGRKEKKLQLFELLQDRKLPDDMREEIACLAARNSVADKLSALNRLRAHYRLEERLDIVGTRIKFIDLIREVYELACHDQQWLLVRECHSLLAEPSVDVAGALAELMVRRLRVVIGRHEGREIKIRTPLNQQQLNDVINKACDDHIERALVQELLLSLGNLVRTQPELFEGLRTIRLHHLLIMCAKNKRDSNDQILAELGLLAPVDIYMQLKRIFREQHDMLQHGVSLGFYASHSGTSVLESRDNTASWVLATDWFEWRISRGLIIRFDKDFLQAIWKSMKATSYIIFGDASSDLSTLDCQRALSSMTPGEENFVLLIEKLVAQVHPAYYKSMVLEALCAFADYCDEYPEANFESGINLGSIIIKATEFYREENIDESKVDSDARNIDFLMQAPPQIAQLYLKRALTC